MSQENAKKIEFLCVTTLWRAGLGTTSSPTFNSAICLNAAGVAVNASANLGKIPCRRAGLTICITSPTFNCTICLNTTGVMIPGADLGKIPCWRAGLALRYRPLLWLLLVTDFIPRHSRHSIRTSFHQTLPRAFRASAP